MEKAAPCAATKVCLAATHLCDPGHVAGGHRRHAGRVVLILAEVDAVETAALQLEPSDLRGGGGRDEAVSKALALKTTTHASTLAR